jgi:hypothetical protein
MGTMFITVPTLMQVTGFSERSEQFGSMKYVTQLRLISKHVVFWFVPF